MNLHATVPPQVPDHAADYQLRGGFPTPDTIERAYLDADLNRAVQAYRFFYPTVSGAAIVHGNLEIGVVDNRVFGILDGKPRHVGFTYNSDTPYAPIMLDLRDGPFVIELEPGPLIVVAIDVNQRWVADMGVPGPDAGKGGKHLLLPPEYEDDIPEGYHVWRPTTNRLIVGVRSLPVGGDLEAAFARIRAIKVHPLHPTADWREPSWPDLTARSQDTTPLKWEDKLGFWEVLHKVIDEEPAYPGYYGHYGELAALGIAKGRPFAPDARMRAILEQAARIGHVQMCVQSFADRRPDRIVWPDRLWEWVGLRPENGDFDTPSYPDLDAREVWFYQAIGASPAMFRRAAGSGSVYWLGLRDGAGAYLDGAQQYRLRIPLPVPGTLFWSVTVYDALTRSQVSTDQDKAALRSLFELKDQDGAALELFFGPAAPAGCEERWIKTIPQRGWFAYFRVYGPEPAAFDGSWKPGDFERLD
ncbi:DUF1254 domain-containing protein [Massilia sp. CFBP9012]|uniref:DUF1254 domain-containing protein n=1 Tax=Massilia sp. CFBP9012 TaxID=3096531 RepID=UPI002A69E3ED|nr:DUF1254 domain-containing protein [Massilia sp. CFBP9012]MDY0976954.1 DUF1254 domain-containing protein [Massilia sp. CFBP9012]